MVKEHEELPIGFTAVAVTILAPVLKGEPEATEYDIVEAGILATSVAAKLTDALH
jgi:hypothetical protein